MIRILRTRDLSAAVARRTGEDIRTIRSRGFQPLDLRPLSFEPSDQFDPESYCVDWDAADAARKVAAFPHFLKSDRIKASGSQM